MLLGRLASELCSPLKKNPTLSSNKKQKLAARSNDKALGGEEALERQWELSVEGGDTLYFEGLGFQREIVEVVGVAGDGVQLLCLV